MTHESIPSIVNALGSAVKVSTIWETKDHYLKDYTPYVQIITKGRINPQMWKVIQAEKGMIVLDARCGLCDCIDLTTSGNNPEEDEVKRKGGFVTLAVTPINEAYERDQINDWVDELQRHFDRARAKKT